MPTATIATSSIIQIFKYIRSCNMIEILNQIRNNRVYIYLGFYLLFLALTMHAVFFKHAPTRSYVYTHISRFCLFLSLFLTWAALSVGQQKWYEAIFLLLLLASKNLWLQLFEFQLGAYNSHFIHTHTHIFHKCLFEFCTTNISNVFSRSMKVTSHEFSLSFLRMCAYSQRENRMLLECSWDLKLLTVENSWNGFPWNRLFNTSIIDYLLLYGIQGNAEILSMIVTVKVPNK